ncbi:MAG: SBBP repeat-containing protein, partial [Thermoplasmatota archaeon]
MNTCRQYALILSVLLLTTFPVAALDVDGPFDVGSERIEDAMNILDGSSAEAFVENLGQWDGDLLFVARTDFGHIGLASDGIYYNIIEKDWKMLTKMDARDRLKDRSREDESITGSVIKVQFEGSNPVEAVGNEELPRISNFYLGNDETRWVSGARSFEKVEYPGIWDGVSIVFRSGEEGLKYDIVLEPLADASDIIFKVQGHDSIKVTEGSLVIDTPAGIPLMDSGLMAFYSDGNGEQVGVNFHVLDENRYTFSLKGRDLKRGVVIDPLVYSTYVGGYNEDIYFDIDLGTNGNLYAAGFSDSTNFPTTTGAYQTRNYGSMDVVVSQVNSGATSLVYSTYVGGSEDDISQGIKIDASGDAYVTGGTLSLDFPTTSNAYNTTHWNTSLIFDVFVFRLDSKGSSLAYSTYVAGEDDDAGLSIDIDSSGNAYVVGFSYSTNFPTTSGAYDTTHNDWGDIILFELSPKGDSLTYSTFFGGLDDDMGNDLIYNNGDIYLTGSSWSYDFPTTSGAYQTTHVDWTDVIVMKF